jgi:hypothetical protein
MSTTIGNLGVVPVYWCGKPPAICDICDRPIENVFIDGRTRMGPWANMDAGCHSMVGIGLGTGRGQRFECVEAGWLKTAG